MAEQSPSQDLADAVGRQLEAANRGDLDTFMSSFAPDAVYDASRDGLGVYEGHEAIRGLIGGWWNAFDDFHLTLEELQDLGEENAFLVLRHDGRPTGSAGHVETRQAYLARAAAGLVVEMTVYGDVEEGRAAAERLARSGAAPG